MTLVKTFENFNLDLSYTDFFGNVHSHEQVLFKELSDGLCDIKCQENKVSEKDFKYRDKTLYGIKNILSENPKMINDFEQMLRDGKRKNYAIEHCWDTNKNILK